MDNDKLIDQARNLYVALEIKQIGSLENERLERITLNAYSRYQRRLNRRALANCTCNNSNSTCEYCMAN